MATLELGNLDLCLLQIACMDRISYLRGLMQGAQARNDLPAQERLVRQLARIEDLLARLVQL